MKLYVEFICNVCDVPVKVREGVDKDRKELKGVIKSKFHHGAYWLKKKYGIDVDSLGEYEVLVVRGMCSRCAW